LGGGQSYACNDNNDDGDDGDDGDDNDDDVKLVIS
jgi:hypothetical protein